MASSPYQLVMGATFDDSSRIKHINVIGHLDSRESMADQNCGPTLGQAPEMSEELIFCPGVERAGRLIEHDDLSIAHERPRQRYLLPFADAELFAWLEPLAEESVVAAR